MSLWEWGGELICSCDSGALLLDGTSLGLEKREVKGKEGEPAAGRGRTCFRAVLVPEGNKIGLVEVNFNIKKMKRLFLGHWVSPAVRDFRTSSAF